MAALSLRGKRFLVVGGTQGIGAATAVALAARGAAVTVAGRSAAHGKDAVLAMEKAADLSGISNEISSPKSENQNKKFEFLPVDVASAVSVRSLCGELRKNHHLLSGVVVTAGGLGWGPRRLSPDGVELIHAQNLIGRFILIQEILAIYSKNSKDSNQNQSNKENKQNQNEILRFVNVLGPGTGAAIDTDDWQLTRNFSVIRANAQAASITDLLTKELAKRHGNLARFFHFFPGIINTNSAQNQGFPWWITAPAKLVLPVIGASPNTTALSIVHLLTSPEYGRPDLNGSLVGPKLNQIKLIKPLADGGQPLADKVWDYATSLAASI